MKQLLSFIAAAVLLCGCGPKEKNPEPAPTEIGDMTIVDAAPTSENSLDYLGRYKGTLNGVETAIELSEDFSYVRTTTEKSRKKTEVKGTFKWNAQGNGIVLNTGNSASISFLVGDDRLVLRDSHQNPINPENSGDGVLYKQSESEAAKSDGTPMDRLPEKISGIHWKLSEIQGSAPKQSNGQDYFVQLNEDGTFGAFAGCNRMGGKYELSSGKIRMFGIISTMMACPEMRIEDEFKKALEIADNYVANQKVLQLRRGETTLLKFDAYDLP